MSSGGPGVRAGRHLPSRPTPQRRRQGPRALLRAALYRHVQVRDSQSCTARMADVLCGVQVCGPADRRLRRAAPGDPDQGLRHRQCRRRGLLPGEGRAGIYVVHTSAQVKLLSTRSRIGNFKGIQWLKIYFCVQFTCSILRNVVLGKTDFEIILSSFLSF